MPSTDDSSTPGCIGDAAVMGALLADVRLLVPVEALADAARWDLPRTHAALTALDTALRPAGLLLHRLRNDVRIVGGATVLDASTLQRLWRRHLADRGLNVAQVGLLKRVRDGTVHLASAGNTEKVRLPELRNAGLIAATAAGTGRGARWELTEVVRYSLLLNELPPSP